MNANLLIESYAPIIISLVALVISAFGLGWTILRDVQKPRFRVSVAKKVLIHPGNPPSDPFILVDALNIGPIPNRVGLVFVRKNWWRRRVLKVDTAHAILPADHGHQATTPSHVLSERIEVGDSAAHAFPYNSECFLKEDWKQIGFADGFGRMHWAPKKQLKELRQEYAKDFG